MHESMKKRIEQDLLIHRLLMLKGPIKNRVQTYNDKTRGFVKIDTENNRSLLCSRNPYKRVQRK